MAKCDGGLAVAHCLCKCTIFVAIVLFTQHYSAHR